MDYFKLMQEITEDTQVLEPDLFNKQLEEEKECSTQTRME